MVNWKLLGIAGLTYLASLGIYNGVNTRIGYDNLGRGLRGGDKGLTYIINETARPISDKLQETIHTPQLGYREPHLENNQHKVSQGFEDVAGYAQLASVIAGLAALVNVGKRKK